MKARNAPPVIVSTTNTTTPTATQSTTPAPSIIGTTPISSTISTNRLSQSTPQLPQRQLSQTTTVSGSSSVGGSQATGQKYVIVQRPSTPQTATSVKLIRQRTLLFC